MPLSLTRTVSIADLVLLAILAGAVATFGLGYSFGMGNHVELLPHIERILDPSFAAGDFSVDASAGGPRQYFARFCALLAGVLPLPAVFLLLTLLQNAGVALITALAARRIFPGAPAAPVLAVLPVLALEGPRLGEAGFLRLPTAVAFSVAMPLALASLWFGLEGRPGRALAAAIPAALIHPLVGLEIAALGLASTFFERTWTALRGRTGGKRPGSAAREAAGSLLALAGLASFAGLAWFRGQPPRALTTEAFIGIYARFRAPHHLWPAAFPPADWIVAAAFLAATVYLARRWRHREPGSPVLASRIMVGLGLVVFAMAAGWFFVQAVPIRLVAILQLFRLMAVLKWFGFILLAGAVAGLARKPNAASRFRLPLALALGSVAILAASSLGRMGEVSLPSRQQGLTLAGLGLVAAAWLGLREAGFRRLASAAVVAVSAGLIALIVLPEGSRFPVAGRLLARTRPVYTLEQGRQREDAAARFCRDSLPPGATLVVPPLLGRIRLVSRRALLADFKFMPTTDAALAEWRRRLEEAYGPSTESGFAAAREMDRGYRIIGEDRLHRLRERYGVGYAVLYAETPCRDPEIYRDRFYKVIKIAGGL
ncbi:MAG: hypothetical protein NTZ26_13455 [Candidatus Aminicenantes bacterium]|nr:hypothetical protein [Candidatus Aminicenantes bacterium]